MRASDMQHCAALTSGAKQVSGNRDNKLLLRACLWLSQEWAPTEYDIRQGVTKDTA